MTITSFAISLAIGAIVGLVIVSFWDVIRELPEAVCYFWDCIRGRA